jgi:hypothetical protein
MNRFATRLSASVPFYQIDICSLLQVKLLYWWAEGKCGFSDFPASLLPSSLDLILLNIEFVQFQGILGSDGARYLL